MGVFAQIAKGSIAPEPDHPALGNLLRAEGDGSLFVKTENTLPSRCSDGRRPITPLATIAPALPGGSLSLLVALAATSGITDPQWGAQDLSARLAWAGAGGSIHAGPDDRSPGCIALDQLTRIITFANEQEEPLRQAADELGLPTATSYPLGSLLGEQIDSAGVYDLFDNKTANAKPLRDVHPEIAIVINHQKGTTIDQNVLDSIGDIDVFDVDAWSLKESANWLADNYDVDQARALSAMSAFTVASLAFLAAPTMTVIRND